MKTFDMDDVPRGRMDREIARERRERALNDEQRAGLSPVDDLRWRPPKPANHRSDVLDATEFDSNCPQMTKLRTFAGPPGANEDCLFLNVFTTNTRQRTPVIV